MKLNEKTYERLQQLLLLIIISLWTENIKIIITVSTITILVMLIDKLTPQIQSTKLKIKKITRVITITLAIAELLLVFTSSYLKYTKGIVLNTPTLILITLCIIDFIIQIVTEKVVEKQEVKQTIK